jgi:hypothetical protein
MVSRPFCKVRPRSNNRGKSGVGPNTMVDRRAGNARSVCKERMRGAYATGVCDARSVCDGRM